MQLSEAFKDKMVLNWAGNDIEIFSTPGHSPGSACITVGDRFFTGDSLLKRGPMNRFPGGNKNDYIKKSIPIIKNQMKKVKTIFPGHGEMFSASEIVLI